MDSKSNAERHASAWFSRNADAILVFAVALVARLLYVWLTEPAPLQFLPYQTDLRALRLINGEDVFYPDAWASFYMVLGAFYEAFEALGLIEQRVMAFVVTQSGMASLSAALVTLLSRRLFQSRGLALAAGLAFGLYYPFLYHNTLVLSETTFVLAVVGALTLLVLPRKRSVLAVQGAGLLLGVALISRPILSPFIPLALIWLVVTGARGTKLRDGVSFVAMLGAVVLVASLVNALVGTGGRFSYNGNTGANFAMAQCEIRVLRYELPNGEYFWFSPPMFWDTDRPEVHTDVPFYETGYYVQMGLDCIRDDPTQLVRNLGHVANVYHSEFYPDFSDHKLHAFAIDAWKVVAGLLTLAFFAFPFAWQSGPPPSDAHENHWLRRWIRSPFKEYVLFAGLLLSMYASVYLASPGEERYMVSYFWLLPLFGLPALVALGQKIRSPAGERTIASGDAGLD